MKSGVVRHRLTVVKGKGGSSLSPWATGYFSPLGEAQ